MNGGIAELLLFVVDHRFCSITNRLAHLAYPSSGTDFFGIWHCPDHGITWFVVIFNCVYHSINSIITFLKLQPIKVHLSLCVVIVNFQCCYCGWFILLFFFRISNVSFFCPSFVAVIIFSVFVLPGESIVNCLGISRFVQNFKVEVFKSCKPSLTCCIY